MQKLLTQGELASHDSVLSTAKKRFRTHHFVNQQRWSTQDFSSKFLGFV
jgi:hypothetical protein